MAKIKNDDILKFGDYSFQRESVEEIKDDAIKAKSIPATLKKGGEIIKLQRLPLKVLAYFLENQGRNLTLDEIKENCWPGYASNSSLGQVITKLRDVFDDKPEDKKSYKVIVRPSYAEYRFTLEVKRPKTLRQKIDLVKTSFIVSVLSFASLFVLVQAIAPPSFERTPLVDLTSLKGEVQRPTYNVDKTLVYSRQRANSELWILKYKEYKGEESILLDDSEKALKGSNVEPAFSPSGEKLAWVSTDYNSYCYVMVSGFNRHTNTIYDAKSVKSCDSGHFARSPQWRNNDSLVVATPNDEGENVIQLIELENYVSSTINTTYRENQVVYGLSYNDEHDLLASIKIYTEDKKRYYAISVYDFKSRTSREIVRFDNLFWSVAWFEDSLIFKGVGGLKLLNLDGRIHKIGNSYEKTLTNPYNLWDGKIGVISGSLFEFDIMSVNTETGESIEVSSSQFIDHRPVVAKNKNAKAYASDRSGLKQVYLDVEGNVKQLSSFTKHVPISDIAISSDAKYVAYIENNHLTIKDIKRKNNKLDIDGEFSGIYFQPDQANFFFSVFEDGEMKIKRLNLTNNEIIDIVQGEMPKMTSVDALYFTKMVEGHKFPVLHKRDSEGNSSILFELTFRQINSNSFDIINDKLYYIHEGYLVSRDLNSAEISKIAPVKGNKFSISSDLNTLLYTEKLPVQTKLSSFVLFDLN